MNRTKGVIFSAAAVAATLVGCSEPPSAAHTGESIGCVGDWRTAQIGQHTVLGALTDTSLPNLEGKTIAQEMGVEGPAGTNYLGFVAVALEKSQATDLDGTLLYPAGCAVEHRLSDKALDATAAEAKARGDFVYRETIQPSGVNVLLTARV